MSDTARRALITGGSRGLGRALTAELTRRGWQVVVDGRDGELLAATAAEFGAVAVPGDIVDPRHRRELAEVAAASGRLDLLVNNASLLGPSPQPRLEHYPLDTLEEVYRVNTFAPLALIQALLPVLRRSHGRIVNISSDAAVEAYDGWGGYGSTKAALDQLTAVLAVENPELRVYAADPGDMATEMHQRAFPGEDISDRPSPESVVPRLLQLIDGDLPSGRYRAADLASVSTAVPAGTT
jgi:NAD(P)-dependent dehydrogenase (short-subunit alcohol dehydrogenase family)